MKKYNLKLEDLIVNTMITVNQNENRRVIDISDINDYEKVILDLANKSEIKIIFDESNYENSKNELKDYILIKENKYIMLPWIQLNDLIMHFRGYLSLDVVLLLCNDKIPNMIKKREAAVINSFKIIETLTADLYTNEIKSEIFNLENKKHQYINKLQKIKKNGKLYG